MKHAAGKEYINEETMPFDISFPDCFCVDSDCRCEVSADPSGNSTTGSVDITQTQKILLLTAVHYDQLEVLEHMLKIGASPNTCDDRGVPLLNLAIEKGNRDVIDTLLHHECNVNQSDRNGQTALICSVCVDDLDLVKLVVKAGANLNEIDNTGKSALLVALREGRLDIAEYLIKKGSDVNIVDRLGQSALYFLASNHQLKDNAVLRKLLLSGYNVTKDKLWLGDDIAVIEKIPKESIVQRLGRKLSGQMQKVKKACNKSQIVTNGNDVMS